MSRVRIAVVVPSIVEGPASLGINPCEAERVGSPNGFILNIRVEVYPAIDSKWILA